MPKCSFCDRKVPRDSFQCPRCGAPVENVVPQAVDDLEQQVRILLGQGQKLEAVKRFKAQTGVGLLEAKEAVEAIGAGKSPQLAEGVNNDVEAQLVRLLTEDKKLLAVKLYKQHTGATLMNAKRAVEALAAKHGMEDQGRGCVSVLMALVALAMGLIIALIR